MRKSTSSDTVWYFDYNIGVTFFSYTLKREHEVEVHVPVSELNQVKLAESLHIRYFGVERNRRDEMNFVERRWMRFNDRISPTG